MPPQYLLKKSSAILTLGLIALIAYFQAQAVTQLVAAALIGDELARTSPGTHPKPVLPPKSVDALLEHNVFDSKLPRLTELEPKLPSEPVGTDPLAAPACQSVVLSIVTESPDPTWSMATLRGPSDTRGRARRV